MQPTSEPSQESAEAAHLPCGRKRRGKTPGMQTLEDIQTEYVMAAVADSMAVLNLTSSSSLTTRKTEVTGLVGMERGHWCFLQFW